MPNKGIVRIPVSAWYGGAVYSVYGVHTVSTTAHPTAGIAILIPTIRLHPINRVSSTRDQKLCFLLASFFDPSATFSTLLEAFFFYFKF